MAVRGTGSHPRKVPKNGKNHSGWGDASPKTASVPEYLVTNPRPSIAEIASTAQRIRKRVCPKILRRFIGLTPRIKPPTIAARKQAVPVAESQVNAKGPPSLVGLGTTGVS